MSSLSRNCYSSVNRDEKACLLLWKIVRILRDVGIPGAPVCMCGPCSNNLGLIALLVGQCFDGIPAGSHPSRVKRAAKRSRKCNQGSVDDPCAGQLKSEAGETHAEEKPDRVSGSNAHHPAEACGPKTGT